MCTEGRVATIGIPGRLKSIAPRVISRYSTVSLGGSAERATGDSLGCTQPYPSRTHRRSSDGRT